MKQGVQVGTNNIDLVTVTLEFDQLVKNVILAKNFWIVIARALIFHMNIPCDKNYLLVLNLFDLDIWPI